MELFNRIHDRLILNEYGEIGVSSEKQIVNDVDQFKEKVRNQYNQNMKSKEIQKNFFNILR